jgi:origin recognition complex subunit 4
MNKSIPAALSTFHVPIGLLSDPQLNLSAFDLAAATLSVPQIYQSQSPDSRLVLLSGLPILCLSLLIAACRLDIIHSTPLVNFNMAYAEYISLASKARISIAAAGQLAVGASGGAKVYGRDVARKEWERLVRYEMLIPGNTMSATVSSGAAVVAGMGTTAGSGNWAMQMYRCDVALEEIVPSVPGISKMMERWCKHI